jgi:RimJ/RimL family protein N-acetyltransferase
VISTTELRPCPILTTPRLTLGPHLASDLDEGHALWSEPAVYRFIGGVPSSRYDAWTRLLRYAGLWPLLGYGYWRVRETATGRLVGEVGFADFGREITPSLEGAPEAGWVLAPWAHGQGFASEATRAMFAWADDVLRAPRTVCMIDPGNAPSLALAAKLGFHRFADASYRDHPAVLLERFAPLAPAPAAQ